MQISWSLEEHSLDNILEAPDPQTSLTTLASAVKNWVLEKKGYLNAQIFTDPFTCLSANLSG